MARSRNRWLLLILALVALLMGLLTWVVLRPSGCGEGSCPPATSTTQPAAEVVVTEPSTEAPTTEAPTTQPTEAPTTQPTEPEPVTMRVVTPVEVLSEPGGQPVQSLSIGETVELREREGDWYPLAEGEGYLPAAALREPERYVIVIDPGHQGKGNREKEPIGPGASEKKPKVASGTQGVVTGLAEYKLTLQVSLKLRELLESRGYEVVMLRTDHDVNISNAERAQLANEHRADAFIRIHANGDSNPDIHGIMTLCQTENNPYNADLHPYSLRLSTLVLEELVKATGGSKKFVWETDTMSGINWCRVPVTIVEMGYMSNPEEDRLMSTEDYQYKLAEGIANGLDAYFTP